MLQPGRKYSPASSYRYGFNGKENDNDVKGIEGSQQDYGMRIYDPRLGKFLSVDPISKDYPWYTPYQFAGNKPIAAVDVDGLEENPYSVGRAVARNEEWAENIRKTDPENAQQRIWKEERWGLFFVVGAMTLGYGFAVFSTAAITTTVITVATSQGVISTVSTISAVTFRYGPDIGNFIYGITTGDALEPFPSNMGAHQRMWELH